MGNTPETVLFATDLSRRSLAGLSFTTRLARDWHARLLLFHTIHFPRDTLYNTDAVRCQEKTARLEAEARRRIAAVQAETEVPFHPVIRTGAPVETLRQVVAEKGVDLVVAVSRGFSGITRLVMGTVVERMARHLPCPLMVTQPRTPYPLKEVAVCCTENPVDNPPVRAALQIAARCEGRLHLLHALARPPDTERLADADSPFETAQAQGEKLICDRLLSQVPPGGPGVPAPIPVLLHGTAAETIADYVAAHKTDLLVVGVRRRTLLGKWLIGSTTEALLRTAAGAVMTIPCSPDEPAEGWRP